MFERALALHELKEAETETIRVTAAVTATYLLARLPLRYANTSSISGLCNPRVLG